MPPIGLPQPVGKNGSKFSLCTAGTEITMKATSAATLIDTSTALTLADLEVPITSSQVTSRAMPQARMLNTPPSYGPVCSARGNESVPGSTSPNRLVCISRPFM